MEAERNRRKQLLDTQAQINVAEGQKQRVILESEGHVSRHYTRRICELTTSDALYYSWKLNQTKQMRNSRLWFARLKHGQSKKSGSITLLPGSDGCCVDNNNPLWRRLRSPSRLNI